MFKFADCRNGWCPYKSGRDTTPCGCGGTGYTMSGESTVPANDPRVKFSWAFRKRHGLTKSTG